MESRKLQELLSIFMSLNLIVLGGISSFAPDRQKNIAELGLHALLRKNHGCFYHSRHH